MQAIELQVPEYVAIFIADTTIDAFKRYVEQGILPGGFATAVLTNDLFGAFGRADDNNLRHLRLIVRWVYNEFPSTCWGSAEKVRAWVRQREEGL